MSNIIDSYVAVAALAGETAVGSTVPGAGAAFLVGDRQGEILREPTSVGARPSRTSSYAVSHRKRAVDIGASALLLAISLPIMFAIALAIKATSAGPVLFMQRRGGAGGKPFTILKFRTMTYGSSGSAAVVQATRDDPRVTKLGRFLREASLDELPQLINVLKGDMSLVGPRPHAIAHDRYYGASISSYDERYAVRPGLTGLAQINGARGGTPQLTDMERRIALDAEYIRDASFLGDMRLLIATPREMLLSKTAV